MDKPMARVVRIESTTLYLTRQMLTLLLADRAVSIYVRKCTVICVSEKTARAMCPAPKKG